MCLITFAYCNHPTYRLILVANRDEFYQRPSLAAHHWPESPHILAGMDQQGGGTWLGITRNGRFAAVTNFRQNPQIPAERSRGELTVRFLSSEASPNSFAHQLQPEVHHYGGFNLLLADNHQMTYCSNRSAAQQTLERSHPEYHAPQKFTTMVRELISSGQYPVFHKGGEPV